MRMAVLGSLALLVAFAAPASAANMVVNGDWNAGEAGWTRWSAPWGAGNWAVTGAGPTPPEGTASLLGGQSGSFGWFQRIPAIPSEMLTVEADWAGDIDGAGWAEVMFFSCTEGMTDQDVITRIDTGNAGDVSYKKDSWGMNPPTAWHWEKASLSKHPTGNGGTIHATCAEVVVGLKLGSVSGAPVWTSWDNITVTPEPVTAMLLGLPILFLRRRHG